MGFADGLPKWLITICSITTLTSILWSFTAIFFQVRNYRKPFEQRLIVRILLIVPLFAISCYSRLMQYFVGAIFEPLREIYEAFVIYTFYKFLVLMLGGERAIILKTVDKEPVSHPFPISIFSRRVNISHPKHFLAIKRCILQYVWMKPLMLSVIFLMKSFGIYKPVNLSVKSASLWLGIIYNFSVSLSLYSLAMFWKCLYEELSIFSPWRKFMCVKLIIFASYWQGLIIGGLTMLGVFERNSALELFMGPLEDKPDDLSLASQVQNGLLCFEMLFFAWFHWNSFPYKDFTAGKLPDAARMGISAAMKDWISIGDLLYDLKITTMYGDSYNLKNFDSMTDSTIYHRSDTFNQKIYQGLRVSGDGKKYWIGVNNGNRSHEYHQSNEITSFGHTQEGVINSLNVKFGTSQNNRKRGDVGSSAPKSSNSSIHSPIVVNQVQNLLGAFSFSKPVIGNAAIHTDQTPLLDSNDIHNYASDQSTKSYLSNIEDLCIGERDNKRIEENNLLNELDEGNLCDWNSDELEDFLKDEKLYSYVRKHVMTEESINYPVVYEPELIEYSTKIDKLRQSLLTPETRKPKNNYLPTSLS